MCRILSICLWMCWQTEMLMTWWAGALGARGELFGTVTQLTVEQVPDVFSTSTLFVYSMSGQFASPPLCRHHPCVPSIGLSWVTARNWSDEVWDSVEPYNNTARNQLLVLHQVGPIFFVSMQSGIWHSFLAFPIHGEILSQRTNPRRINLGSRHKVFEVCSLLAPVAPGHIIDASLTEKCLIVANFTSGTTIGKAQGVIALGSFHFISLSFVQLNIWSVSLTPIHSLLSTHCYDQHFTVTMPIFLCLDQCHTFHSLCLSL